MEKLNVKVGDTVIFCAHSGIKYVTQVRSITPKGSFRVEFSPGILFNEYGRQKGGDGYNFNFVFVPTEEELKKYSEAEQIRRVIDMCHKVNQLTYKQAVSIWNVLVNNKEVK